MAKATKVIHRIEPSEEEIRQRELEQVEATLIENKEGVMEALELLRRLQENGVFEILNATLAQREEVIGHIVTAMDNADTTKSLKNVLLMFDTLGKLNIEELEPLVQKMNKGISKVAEYELEEKKGRGGYSALLSSITDKEVMEGANTLMAFVKGFGVDQEEKEQTEQKPRTTSPSPTKKWIATAAGISLLALPILFKK
ncbi:helical membrane plugin domain-containing protein [Virgibacillus ainsalahensis]